MAEPRIFLPRGTTGQGLPPDMFTRELVWTEQTRQLWIKAFDGIAYPVGGQFSQYYSLVSADYTAKPAEHIIADLTSDSWALTLPPVKPVGCPVVVTAIGDGILTVNPNGQTIDGSNATIQIWGGETATFIQGATGWLYWPTSNGRRLIRLVSASHEIQASDRTIFYLIDQAASPTLYLPANPTDANPWIDNLYWIGTLAGSGSLTVSAQGNPINGVEMAIEVPPERELKIAWVGGATGWSTDRDYTRSPGLLGKYYFTNSLSGNFIERIDSTIDFDWGNGAPFSGYPTNNFSINWTGYVTPPITGIWQFSVYVDDGAILALSGNTLINYWQSGIGDRFANAVNLEEGIYYPLSLSFLEVGTGAQIKFYWKEASYPSRVIVPSSALYH